MLRVFALLALLAGSLAASPASPQELIDANKGQFRALEALIAKAGLQDIFKDASKDHTFFLPLDHSFTWFKEYLPTLEGTEVKDVVAAIEASEPENAKKFVEHHIVHKAIPNVDALLSAMELKSVAGVRLTVDGDSSYVNVMEADGFSGTVAGPMAIPVGKSFVYVMTDGLLADPAVVLGHGPLDSPSDEEEFDVIFDEDSSKDSVAAPPPAEEHEEL